MRAFGFVEDFLVYALCIEYEEGCRVNKVEIF